MMRYISNRMIKKVMLLFAVIVGMTQTAWGQTGNWTDCKASGYASGSGTAADPYVIKTAEQLAYFSAQVTSGKDKSVYVNLGADIDLSGHFWVPIGALKKDGNAFTGVFDGKGYKISNMTVVWSSNAGGDNGFGLFAWLGKGTATQSATIRNLLLSKPSLQRDANSRGSGASFVAPLVGGVQNSYVCIENIIVRESKNVCTDAFNFNDRWLTFGGMIGKVIDGPTNYTFRNLYTDTDIDVSSFTGQSDHINVGGLIGECKVTTTTLTNVFVTGSIKVQSNIKAGNAGAVMGKNDETDTNEKFILTNVNYVSEVTDGNGNAISGALKTGKGDKKEKSYLSDFISTLNTSIAEESGPLKWKIESEGLPRFSIIKLNRGIQRLEKKEVLSLEGFTETEGVAITWTIDEKTGNDIPGVTISGDNKTLTVPVSKKERSGSVTINGTIGGTSVNETINFIIAPRYYSIDLYADAYAKDGEGNEGDGTKEHPYLISDDMQLALLARQVNASTSKDDFAGKYYKLTGDVTLGDALWIPIGTNNYANENKYFYGKFDGDGHVVKDMTIEWYSDAEWGAWGLFAVIQGKSTDEAGFASVTNLIIDGAELYKKANHTPSTKVRGIDLGTLVGEALNNTEISNVIVRNSKITDNDEVYSYPTEDFYIGGVVGSLGHYEGGSIVRVFNLSSDTEINVAKNHTANRETFCFGGIVGRCAVKSQSNAMHIYPTNIYCHGKTITTNDKNSYKRADIAANFSKQQPTAAQQATWYYVNAEQTNFGTQKTLEAFAKTFAANNNQYIRDNSLSDRKTWIYSVEGKYFSFGSSTLTFENQKKCVLTASTEGETEEKYNWYVSTDKETWEKQETATDIDGSNVTLPCNPFYLSYKDSEQYVFAEHEDGTSGTDFVTVPALRITDVSLKETEKTYTVNVFNSIWGADNSNLTISYTWYNDYENNKTPIPGQTSSSYTYNGEETSPKISCNVIVTYNGEKIADEWVGGERVVYLCPAYETLTITTGEGENKKTEVTAYIPKEVEVNGVIYKGSDANDGLTASKPKFTWQGAYAALNEKGSWKENKIVLIGTSDCNATFLSTSYTATEPNKEVNLKGFAITANLTGDGHPGKYDNWKETVEASKLNRNTTITGSHNGTDYQGVIEMKENGEQGGLGIFGDTRFERITFKHKGGKYDILFCQYNNLEMGEGIVMQNYVVSPGYGKMDGTATMSFQIFGGFNNDNRFAPVYKKDDLVKMQEAMPHGKEGFRITLKSGFYSCICAGGRQNGNGLNGIMGTPDMPVKCTIEMDVNREWNDKDGHNLLSDKTAVNYDAGIIMAGNHEGAMFGDVDIIIKSGYVGRVVNGTLGNVRNYNFTESGTTYYFPNNTYMGRANILLDPASSRYATKDDTETVTNARVVVTELYGGSCGRGFQNNIVVDNPFYGISTVTIKGGTFKPIWPVGVSAADKAKTISGIFGAGAGGMTGLGDATHPTPDDRIPYWSGDNLLYGNYSAAFTKRAKYRCYNADTHTFTDIDPNDTKTSIVIEGGVFGTETDTPFDGIYGGGSGYMATGLWTDEGAIPNINGGNIYGKNGQTVASLTIKGGKFYCKNGIFAGGRGTDYYYAEKSYGAKGATNGNYTEPTAKDYNHLGQTYGNVELNITGGEFHCPVFGGGYGVADAQLTVTTTDESGTSTTTKTVNTLSDMALITGRSIVRINGGTFYGNVYGGGDMARIDLTRMPHTLKSVPMPTSVVLSLPEVEEERREQKVIPMQKVTIRLRNPNS